MRRPVIFLFLSFTFGIAMAYHLKPAPFHFLIFAAAVAAIYTVSRIAGWRQDKVGLGCLFLLAVLLGCVYFYLAEHASDPLEVSEGKTCTVGGRIITIQIRDESAWQMLITAPGKGKRLVQVKGVMEDPAEYIGKYAVVSGKVALPSERRNPGLFDYRLYLKTKGVRVILQSDEAHISLRREGSSIPFVLMARLKYGFMDQLENAMDPEAYGLMVGMLFGDCSFIGDDVYEAFQKNGVAHILSVSGIHVGILYLYLSKLLGNRKTRGFYLLTALLLVFYAALSEFSPSVIRAVVMIIIHMFSKVSYRRYDFISCTSASALGMLLVNPFYLFNAGFQLSYLAIFCLASMLPWMNRLIRIMEERGKSELLTAGLRIFSPLLIIQAGMTPLTAYLFNYFSVVSLFLNIPIIAISGIIIPLGICLIPLSFLHGVYGGEVIFGVGAQAAELLIDVMLWLNELFFLPGVGFFNMVSPSIFLLLVFYGFFFFLPSEYFRILYQRRQKRIMAGSCCLILLSSIFLSLLWGPDYRSPELIFVDVGQGDCLHIRTRSGKNILIDGGGSLNYEVGSKTLLPYFLKNGVSTIDLAIVTHPHTDHYLGIAQLARKMEVKQLGIYEANRLQERELMADTGLGRKDLLYLGAGDRIRIDEDIWIDVLYPEKKAAGDYERLLSDKEDENRSCLFMKIYYQGLTVMMTGDIGEEGEQEIMERYRENPDLLDVDVLKVGHHGSRYSTGDAFLDLVSPEIAVFQVGKNNFGHPHPSVIEKCVKKGIMIYRNDLDGAIIFDQEGQEWHIKTLLRKSTHIKE